MFIAMNRFKVNEGHEEQFEDVWRNRKTSLNEMPGFIQFHLMRSSYNKDENYTLFASHTVWETEEAFIAWTKSQNFRDAHKNAGNHDGMYQGHPQFEGFNQVVGA